VHAALCALLTKVVLQLLYTETHASKLLFPQEKATSHSLTRATSIGEPLLEPHWRYSFVWADKTAGKESAMADGEEEREEQKKRREQETYQEREDNLNRDWFDPYKPERRES
jgi:hypothetical protein